MESLLLLTGPVIALAVVVLVTPLMKRVALATGAVDSSGGSHGEVRGIPKLGGVGVFLGLALGLSAARAVTPHVFDRVSDAHWAWVAVGAWVMLAVGVVDDLTNLRPRWKLAGQFTAALAAIQGGQSIEFVTNLLRPGYLPLEWMAVPLTLLWIVLVANAINLLDGLDGLATGIGLIMCATLTALCVIRGDPDAALVAATLGCALAGFLIFNWHPATIFLGDSGSLLLGYVLAVLSIYGRQKGSTLTLLLVPLLALGLPLFDTAVTIIRRVMAAGLATIAHSDREHVHHRLLELGLNHRVAVLTLYLVTAVLGVAALTVLYLHGTGQTLLVVCVAVAMGLVLRALGYTDWRRVARRDGESTREEDVARLSDSEEPAARTEPRR